MTIPFYKYHGAGNDFIMIDQRREQPLTREDQDRIRNLCDRHFGIGADGLILLEEHNELDFEMIYFNSDGNESTLCGNGGRCITAFAHFLGIQKSDYRFMAIDGIHHAKISKTDQNPNWVELEMQSIDSIGTDGGDYIIDTGSPHFVRFVDNLDGKDIRTIGAEIRFSPTYNSQGGINVNLVEPVNGALEIRTYERGVENETLACGTGVTAAALAYAQHQNLPDGTYTTKVKARGGNLELRFKKTEARYTDIWLCGPAAFVFEGKIEL